MRKVLMVVVGALAALSVGAAGAYFTAQAQVPENMIKAGSVVVSAEPTSAALSIDGLAPGTTTTKAMSIVNEGDLPASVVVTCAKKAGITAFYEALTCHVAYDGNVLYDGPLSSLKTSEVTLPAAGRAQLQFAVGLPESVGNDMAGDYAKLTLYIDAEQVH